MNTPLSKTISKLTQKTVLPFVILCSPLAKAESLITLDPFPVVAESQVPLLEQQAGLSTRTAKPLDLASVLAAELPGVAKARRGPVAGDIVLRGLSRDNILVSVDQTKTYCACPNRMDPPAFHVSSEQIESVRVRSGPFTVDQGSTLGGQVQVFTKAVPENAFLQANLFTGSYNYFSGGISAGTPIHSDSVLLGGFYFQRGDVYEDGNGRPFTSGVNYRPDYREGSAFKIDSLDAKVNWRVGEDTAVGFAYGFQDARDVFYPGLRMDALKDRMHRASLSATFPSKSALADSASLILAFSDVDHDMRDSFRLSSDPGANPMLQNPMMALLAQRVADRGFFMRTEARSQSLSLIASAEKQTGSAFIRYGADLNRRTWDADNVVGPNSNFMLPDVNIDTIGVWAVYETRIADWEIEAGARLDYARSRANDPLTFLQSRRPGAPEKASDTLPSAYLLASRKFTNHLRAYAGFGSGSRVPDPQERFIQLDRPMQNPDWVGNPQLEAPRSNELQAGFRYLNGPFSVDGQLFHAWLDQHIYLLRQSFPGNGNATTYTGIDARLYGFQVSGSWQLIDSLTASGGFAWQKGILESPNPTGQPNLGEIPPLRARAALQWEHEAFSLRATLQFQDDLDRIDPSINERPLPGWTTLDLQGSWRLNPHLTLSGGVDNLFDENYAVANSFVRDPFSNANVVHEPGRTFYARIDTRF